MGRGMLTPEVQALANEYLGREINVTELRLYPHIDYCIKNNVEPKISPVEIMVVAKLDEQGHLLFQGGKIFVSPGFYDYLQAVLKISYVSFEAWDAYKSLNDLTEENK